MSVSISRDSYDDAGEGVNMSSTIKRSRGSESPTESSHTQSSKRNRAVATPDSEPGIAVEEFTVGWVCALPLEMAAAKGMLDHSYPDLQQQDSADHNSYMLGRIQGHNIVIACLPTGIYGTTPAATVAKDLLRTFKSIRFGLIVGIGGGAPSQLNDIRLGDVVVSKPSGTHGGVIQFDRGKTVQEGEFQRTGSLNMPPQLLLTALSRLQAEHLSKESLIPQFVSELVAKSPKRMKTKFSYQGSSNDCLFKPEYDHHDRDSGSATDPGCSQCDTAQKVPREARDDTEPVIHYGNIASGNQVIKHGKTRDRLSKQLGTLCFEMEAAGLQDFPCLVIRGICDYADSHKNKMWQEYAAATAAAFAKELLSFIPPERVRQEQAIPQLISVAKKQLKVTAQHLDVSSEHLIEHRRTNQLLEDRSIELRVVREAYYDSADVRDSPRCEIGTRTQVMKKITQWAVDDSPKSLFWLVGPAGTGKSTIARTVADFLASKNRLAAGYFFKRGEQGRNDTSRLFSTLTMQLIETIPSFKGYLQRSLDSLGKDAVEQRSLEFQVDKLLWNPLGALPSVSTSQGLKVIIIDALDECERPEHFPRVIALLSRLCDITTVRLRVLVTSRSSPKITDAFEPLVTSKAVLSLELHREFPEDTKDDIRTFLEARFADIKKMRGVQQTPWPVAEDLDRLVQLATNPEPLFIYAATLCRFIYDEQHPRNPKAQLKQWLKQCEENKSQLGQMYYTVLDHAFSSASESESSRQLQFLGAIVLLVTPLAAPSLASLLRIDMDDVNWWLLELHVVLDISVEPENPIRLLHKSFSDFLLSPDNSIAGFYRVEPLETHAALASGCLQCMESELRRDICNLRKLDIFLNDIDKQVIDRHIPSHLRYACLHWNYHLQRSGRPMVNEVCKFLYEHFLHWLEALSLLGCLSDGAIVITSLVGTFQQISNIPMDLIDFLQDARELIAHFASMIGRAPLQSYGALLYFSPTASQVRQRFWHQRLPSHDDIQGTDPEWDLCRQVLEGHHRAVLSVAFSPDGEIVASTSSDNTARFWDTSTGILQQTLDFECFPASTIKFTTNGQLVALSSFHTMIELWSRTVGTPPQTLVHDTDSLMAVSCSHNGQVVVTASSNFMVRLWDTLTGSLLQTVDCSIVDSNTTFSSSDIDSDWDDKDLGEAYGKYGYCIAISNNRQIVALVPRNNKVWIWDTTTSSLSHVLETHDDHIQNLDISHDSQVLASSNWTGREVRLWDVTTGKLRHTLHHQDCGVVKVAFSPNDQALASGGGTSVWLWDVATGALQHIFTGHSSRIHSLAFSPNGEMIASGSLDATVRLWTIAKDVSRQVVRYSEPKSKAMVLSPDEQFVASASMDRSLRLWEASTGALRQILWGHHEEVKRIAFSFNSQMIASGSEHGAIYLWDVEVGAPQQLREGNHEPIWALAFSPDNTLLASSRGGEGIQLWDVTRGKLWKVLDDPTTPRSKHSHVTAISFSPDSQFLATVQINSHWASRSKQHDIQIWDPNTGDLLGTIHEPERNGIVSVVAFSSNNQIIVSTSNNGTIQLWDTAAGNLLQTTHVHVGSRIKNLVFDSSSSISLLTDFGIIDVSLGSSAHSDLTGEETVPTVVISKYGLSRNLEWIIKDNKKIMWIPPSYRPVSVVIREPIMFVSCASGHVIRYKLAKA